MATCLLGAVVAAALSVPGGLTRALGGARHPAAASRASSPASLGGAFLLPALPSLAGFLGLLRLFLSKWFKKASRPLPGLAAPVANAALRPSLYTEILPQHLSPATFRHRILFDGVQAFGVELTQSLKLLCQASGPLNQFFRWDQRANVLFGSLFN